MTNQTLAIRGYVFSGDEAQLQNYDSSVGTFEEKFVEMKTNSHSTEAKKLLQTLESTHMEYQEVVKQALDFRKSGNEQGYIEIMNGRAKEVGSKFNQTIEELLQFQSKQVEKGIEQKSKAVAQTGETSLVILILSLVIGIG